MSKILRSKQPIRLENVYKISNSPTILYELLKERESWQSISHKKLPSMAEHVRFMASRPYRVWYLVMVRDADSQYAVGSCYMTKHREIGVFIFRQYQRKGLGAWAVQDMLRRWPGPIRANIAPGNMPSQLFFERLGFKHVQNTFLRT